jgi:hypothetical protein
VSAHDFSFALELSDDPQYDTMLAELAGAVCAHVGMTADAAAQLTGDLRKSLADAAARGAQRCDVRFQSHGGALDVVVSFAGGGEWRTTCALPAQS